jgi:hypothetical protein
MQEAIDRTVVDMVTESSDEELEDIVRTCSRGSGNVTGTASQDIDISTDSADEGRERSFFSRVRTVK